MKTITDPALAARIAEKAPVWAQDVIYALDRQLDEARKQIAALNAGPEDSNVRVHDHSSNPDRLLGRDTPVSFDLGDGTIVIKHDGNGLHVYGTGSGHSSHLHILPSSGNTVEIQLGVR
jgi:hypothetical protein